MSILWTISYIYFSWNLSKSRDSARLTDYETIQKNINLFKVERESLPLPDNITNITYSGSVVWRQGVFWSGVTQKLKWFWKNIPNDPLYWNEYTYSITPDNTAFQIWWILENTESSDGEWVVSSLIPSAHANSWETAYIVWTYNGFIVQTIKNSIYYLISSPSIIANNLSNPDLLQILSSQKIVFTWFKNLPHSYLWKTDVNGGFYFDTTQPIVFSWTQDKLYSYDNLLSIDKSIKDAYFGTPIQNTDRYLEYISSSSISWLKSILSKYFKISWDQPLDCQDIKDTWWDISNKYYTIDPDGKWPLIPTNVYCDMITDGWGWTRIGDNHLTNGDFTNGSWITSESWSNPNNTIISMTTPISSWYAVHQYCSGWWSEGQCAWSEYEVHFNDLSKLKAWYEIWMSLWVTDAWDGGFPTVLAHNPSIWYLFHNRIFYTDGTNTINGPIETLDTKVVWWKTWKLQRVRTKILKTPSNFHWYIGYDGEKVKDLYFTGVRLELYRR